MLTLGWNNVVSSLYQRCAMLFPPCFNIGHWRCINVVQCCKSDVGFCFIFNFGSTLFQRWFTPLKQRWSDVEMLAGNSLWYVFSNKALANICNMHISSLKSKWFYNWTLNWKAHLFISVYSKKKIVSGHSDTKSPYLCPTFFWNTPIHHRDGCQALGINSSSIFAFWGLRLW